MNTKHAWAIITVISYAVVIAAVSQYMDSAIDDAYITWRYAKHLAEGYGIRWNRDDPLPTQGYTSTTWLLVNALAIKLGLNPIMVSKILAYISLAIIVLIAVKMIEPAPDYTKLALAASLILFPVTAAHLWSGMETVAYAAVLILVAYFTLKAIRSSHKRYVYLTGFFSALAYLTRPEGALAGFAALAAIFLMKRNLRKHTFASVALLTLTVAVHLLFSTIYFGYPLPLPAYRKIGTEFDFLSSLLSSMSEWGVIVAIALVMLFMVGDREDLETSIILLAIAAASFSPYIISSRTMSFGLRYAYPSIILSIVAFFIAVRKALERPVHAFGAMLFIISVGMAAGGEYIVMPTYGLNLLRESPDLAEAILKTAGRDGRVAIGDIGYIGYYTDAHICDLLGLTNPEMAIHGNDKNAVIEFLERCNPDLIIVPSKCRCCVDAYYFPQRVAVEFAADRNYAHCNRAFMFSDSYYHRVYARQKEWCKIIDANTTEANG